VQAFIGVGSNIDPEINIPHALDLLRQSVRITGISTFYRTPALGREDQPPFYNGVVAVDTELPPCELKFAELRRIEERLGRWRGADRYAPRTIDLDLILYDDLVIEDEDLILPDPEIAQRAFLAVPLCELAPALVLPDGRAVCNIVEELSAQSLEALPEFSHKLHERFTRGLEGPRSRGRHEPPAYRRTDP